jgi:hypothetical protein
VFEIGQREDALRWLLIAILPSASATASFTVADKMVMALACGVYCDRSGVQ